MKRSAFVFFFAFLAAALPAGAQVVETANIRTFTITAGGIASGFKPGAGTDHLIGPGTFVDLHFTRWIQLEAEARWLRFDQGSGDHQDHYLIGPRVPIHQFGRAHVYGKALIGVGSMTFHGLKTPQGIVDGHGTFTALAFGGGMDYQLSRKLTLRAVDFEYQDWPKFLPGMSIQPYGVSVGMAYRVF